MRKYISAYLLIFCMLTAVTNNNVYADDTLVTEYSDGTFTYELYQKTDGTNYVSVTHCSITENTITVPDGVVRDGISYKVSKIDSYSFSKATSASVILPVSVEIIADNAFYECTALENIQIPESIANIGNWAFGGCTSLGSISVSGENISIGEWAFCDCTALSSADLSGVVSLGTDAFNGCSSLTTVSLSSDMKSIAAEAFFGCYNLTDIYYNGTQSEWNAVEIGADNEYLEKATVHFTNSDEPVVTIPTVTTVATTETATNTSTTTESVTIQRTTATTVQYVWNDLIGDTNLDGRVGVQDIIILNKHLLGQIQLSEQALRNADCKNDTIINIDDLDSLMRYLVSFIPSLPE